jgi:hypothetical protein
LVLVDAVAHMIRPQESGVIESFQERLHANDVIIALIASNTARDEKVRFLGHTPIVYIRQADI